MRIGLVCCSLLVFGAGCTNHRLRQSVVNQTGTLTGIAVSASPRQPRDAQRRAVGLAGPRDHSRRFGPDPGRGHGVGRLGAHADLAGLAEPDRLPDRRRAVGRRAVTEKVELQVMRVAYRRALGHGDRLEIELANDIAHEVCDQISNSDDIDLVSDPTKNASSSRS